MKRHRCLAVPFLATCLLGVVGAQLVRRAPDDEMSPSLLRGDILLILPLAPKIGDVVAIRDPLDPARETLRRVLALDRSDIRFLGHEPFVNGQVLRQVEMDRTEDSIILKEADRALIRVGLRPSRQETETQRVPPNWLFLMADSRELALDSRSWGPVPPEAILGVVVLRYGEASIWRERLFRP